MGPNAVEVEAIGDAEARINGVTACAKKNDVETTVDFFLVPCGWAGGGHLWVVYLIKRHKTTLNGRYCPHEANGATFDPGNAVNKPLCASTSNSTFVHIL